MVDLNKLDPWDLPSIDIPSLSVSDISALNDTTFTGNGSYVYTSSTYTSPNYTYNPGPWTISDDLTIKEKGIQLEDGADIKFGDVSLKQTLKEIADRLAILVPDVKLEREYEELRQAREHYEHVKQKLTMLEKLKNTPVELPR